MSACGRGCARTAAQVRFRQGGPRRLAVAAGIALLALLLLVWLGPQETGIVRSLTYYGAPGELEIMPEISIDDGADAMHRLPRSLQVPPVSYTHLTLPTSDLV